MIHRACARNNYDADADAEAEAEADFDVRGSRPTLAMMGQRARGTLPLGWKH